VITIKKVGELQITVDCPPGDVSISGGYQVQGTIKASYRSDSAGNDTGTTSWTIVQTSAAQGSGTAYVQCEPA